MAVNFVDGALLDATAGPFGTATPKRCRGSLEMGGSSSQISFFKPDQDVLAGLFKLQLGTRAHINLFGHSYLHYGRVSSRRLYWSHLAKVAGCWTWDDETGAPVSTEPCEITDHCLPEDQEVSDFALTSVTGVFGVSPPLFAAPVHDRVKITGAKRTKASAERCERDVRDALFDPAFNRWCEYSHNGQCSYIGVYQPRLPTGPDYGNFVLLGNYVKLFDQLSLGNPTTLGAFHARAREVCGATTEAMPEGKLTADEFCFVAAFAYETLTTGHGFDGTRNLTAVDKMGYNGNYVNVGWPLGAMLYEINALPWTYVPPVAALARATPAPTAGPVPLDNVAPGGEALLRARAFPHLGNASRAFVLRRAADDADGARTRRNAAALAACMVVIAALLGALQRRNARKTGGRDAWADADEAADLDHGRAANCCDAWAIAPPAPPAASSKLPVHSPRQSLRSGSLP